MQSNLKINYYGYFTPFGGYGIANINWVKHLKRLGVDVNVHPKFKPKEGSSEWNILDDEEKSMFEKPFEKRSIGIIETNPFDFESNISDVRIANTMCESDRVSSNWPGKLSGMDYIVVPTEFCKTAFKNSGVTKDITVIPHGVDTDRFYYIEREEKDIFRFGTLGYFEQTDRKGVFDVIRAFTSEFNNNEPVSLSIHSSDPLFGYYKEFTDKRITVSTNQKSFEEVRAFYADLDCFVFPSKAEGVGYPPREAMATGLPVILTNWSALEEVAMPNISYPLTPVKLETRPNFIEQEGNWAIIDVAELMYWMRYVYENRKEASAVGKRASEYIGQVYSWSTCAQKMKTFLEDVYEKHFCRI